eukprot:12958320-Heterocapsa_arctica.AAC.1
MEGMPIVQQLGVDLGRYCRATGVGNVCVYKCGKRPELELRRGVKVYAPSVVAYLVSNSRLASCRSPDLGVG